MSVKTMSGDQTDKEHLLGIARKSPSLASVFSDDPIMAEPFEQATINVYKKIFISDLKKVAPDLRSNNLAEKYSSALFDKINKDGSKTVEKTLEAGKSEFYHVGKDVLGPIAASFVDAVLKDCHGSAIFPARDATPFWYIAKRLKELTPEKYPLASENIQNPVFNRTIWGISDEQDAGSQPLSLEQPLVAKLLHQMGFFTDSEKTFIEVGSWGSMVHQLNSAMTTGKMPKEKFKVYFFYSHLPEYIYGYANLHCGPLPDEALETIADTWEAFPKFFEKPTKLVQENGVVKADLKGKLVDSLFLPAWTFAALQGVVDAAENFVNKKQRPKPEKEILKLWGLSKEAKAGKFTGVLPEHTETWSEGLKWKETWAWGKVPPLV